ncbi:metalloregulator ArsR/SmtB family transcription factor [bacterium]|nr:metalloregulator ArsR/SmtB family transcription factor [bacterium]MCB2201885.1 metalloregulator ArsR/SmtB family transcription factor [bacterium]
MVDPNPKNTARVFSALGEETRFRIVEMLVDGPRTVSELASHFSSSLPAVSKHLKVLEKAGLVRRKKVGRSYICRLEADPLVDAMEWLEQYRVYWEKQLDSLVRYLNAEQKS